jgi:hypothetical protein
VSKLLRVPQRMPTLEMLIGTLEKLEDIQTIVVIVEDDEGVWTMLIEGTTRERINWMLDRAKIMLHED